MADVSSRWASWVSVLAIDRSHLGTISRQEVAHAVRVSVASVLSWWLAKFAGLSGAPYMAPVACVMYIQPSVYESFSRAMQRMVGVILGVGLAVALFTAVGEGALGVGLVVFIGLLAAMVMRLGPGGSVQIALSGLVVLGLVSLNPGYPGQRILETMLGVGVGVVVVALTAPPAVAPAQRAAATLVDEASLVFRSLGQILDQGWSRPSGGTIGERATQLRDMADEARVKMERAAESLRFNPRARSARPTLEQARMKVEALHPVSRRTMTTVNLLNDGTEETASMPHLSRLLVDSSAVIEAYGAWCDSPTDPELRQRLEHNLAAAGGAWSSAATAVEEKWKDRSGRWLRFGMMLPLCGLVGAEAQQRLDQAVQREATSGPAAQ